MSARAARFGASQRQSAEDNEIGQERNSETKGDDADGLFPHFRFSENDEEGEEKPSAKSSLRFRGVSNGYWVTLLLPLSLYLGDDLSDEEGQTLTAVGIILVHSVFLSIFRWLDLDLRTLFVRLRLLYIGLGFIIMAICILHGGHIYEVASYVALYFTFPYLFYNIVKQHPKSFSFGEGVLVTSAFAYQFWKSSQNLPFPSSDTLLYLQEETVIVEFFLQLVFFGAVLGARVVLLLQKPWKLFILEEMLCLWAKYCAMAFFVRVLGGVYDDSIAAFFIMWPFKFLIATRLRVKLLAYWAFISAIIGGFLIHKTYTVKKRTTTIDRKVFHFGVVFVFLPGIFWDITMIYCCSGVLFFIMALFEVARVLKFEVIRIKIGEMIDEKVKIFRDRQDEGRLLLTPIYLLVGCATPIWLNGLPKFPGHLEPIQYVACLSGIISIGIGDTFASIGGTYYGRTRWDKGTRKTVEGTISCMIAQLLVALLIFLSGVIPYNSVSVTALLVAIIVNSIVEGNTDQIDNLVLPLVTYITVHLCSIVMKSLQ